MPPSIPTTIHLLARRSEGQWVVACLDFDLAAQDCSFEAAQRRLLDQVESYVQEALTIDCGSHASELLNRRAPLAHWALFYLGLPEKVRARSSCQRAKLEWARDWPFMRG
jgi:hypothetical protein